MPEVSSTRLIVSRSPASSARAAIRFFWNSSCTTRKKEAKMPSPHPSRAWCSRAWIGWRSATGRRFKLQRLSASVLIWLCCGISLTNRTTPVTASSATPWCCRRAMISCSLMRLSRREPTPPCFDPAAANCTFRLPKWFADQDLTLHAQHLDRAEDARAPQAVPRRGRRAARGLSCRCRTAAG